MTSNQPKKRTRNRPSGAITLSPQFLAWARERNLTYVTQTIEALQQFRSLKTYPTVGRTKLEERRKRYAERLAKVEEALRLMGDK
jgi:hypothetical protein